MRPIQQKTTRLLILIWLILATVAFVLPSSVLAVEADELHWRAWDQNLDSIGAVPAARYAFYAYRSLAVQHPEVYLAADRLVSEVLEDLPGGRLAYRSRDLRDIELYLRLARRELKSGSFTWGMMSMVTDSVYDESPVRSSSDWLELRAPSVAILLKADSPRLSTLESALLRFTQFSRTRPYEGSFIVLDKKGVGYLATDSGLWVAGLSQRRVADWKDVSPVLVFNERAVFSSLVGRDDRSGDSLLASLMDRLGKPAEIGFGSKESARLARLRRATSLPTVESRRLSVLAAAGLTDYHHPRVAAAWQEYLGADSASLACAVLCLDQVYFWANRLSTYAAKLAVQLSRTEILAAAKTVDSTYLDWVGRRVNPQDTSDLRVEAWGCLWSYDLMLSLIDDNARTRAGSSSSQALAMSAALDLAGVEHFQLGVLMGDKQIADQAWLIAANGKLQFNLGVWNRVPDTLTQGNRPASLLISGFALRGESVRVAKDVFCASVSSLAVTEQFTRMVRSMPLASMSVIVPTGEVTPAQKFLLALGADQYSPGAAVWPQMPEE